MKGEADHAHVTIFRLGFWSLESDIIMTPDVFRNFFKPSEPEVRKEPVQKR